MISRLRIFPGALGEACSKRTRTLPGGASDLSHDTRGNQSYPIRWAPPSSRLPILGLTNPAGPEPSPSPLNEVLPAPGAQGLSSLPLLQLPSTSCGCSPGCPFSSHSGSSWGLGPGSLLQCTHLLMPLDDL